MVITAVGIGIATPAHAQIATKSSTAASPGPFAGPWPTLPGLTASPEEITLITGDEVDLQPVGAGNHYSASARPAPRMNGSTPVTRITARTDPSGVQAITARPGDAEGYLQSGSVDPGLFDVSYLASHETSGHLRIMVQYATPMADSDLVSKAQSLPGSTLVQTEDDSNAAEVDVDLGHADMFWAAITGETNPAPLDFDADRLAGGIAAVWLDGHRLGNPGTATPATVLTYTFTEIVHASSKAQLCARSRTVCVIPGEDLLYGIDGAGQGSSFSPLSSTCVDTGTASCNTQELTFRVPAGRYWLSGEDDEELNNHEQWVVLDDPEIRVVNDTTLEFHLDDASQVVNDTPRPTNSDPFAGYMERVRTLPDGSSVYDLDLPAYGYDNFWAVPTPSATVGSYYLKVGWHLGQPLLTMSVAGTNQPFHPDYPGYGPGYAEPERFHGSQTAMLVDGGTGSTEELAKADVRGKLVLVRPSLCLVTRDLLQNAIKAGAIGVLIDPIQPQLVLGACTFPIYPYWILPDIYGSDHVRMPFAELDSQEAQTLRGLMNKGPTKVTLTDNGEAAYTYSLTDIVYGHIPTSLTHTWTSNELAETDTRYQSAQPSDARETGMDLLANEWMSGAINYEFAAPTSHKSYYAVSPELLNWRTVVFFDPSTLKVFSAAGKDVVHARSGPIGSEVWGDQPEVPGVPVFTGVPQARPDLKVLACSGCRQGNTFMPWAYYTSSDPEVQGIGLDAMLAGLAPKTVHLFQNGVELGQTTNSYGVSAYTLPAEQASYRLTMDAHNSHTTWNFMSAEPTVDRAPIGYPCAGSFAQATGPCDAVPLIFLRYDAGTDMQQSVSAPAVHRLHIRAYSQRATAAPVIEMKVWTSVDGGTTWTPAKTASPGGGAFTATYHVPDVSDTDGAVSLKVQARDSNGNDVTQVITDAFGLTTRS